METEWIITAFITLVTFVWTIFQQVKLVKLKHVHRIQFEKEFVVYNEIWESLIRLKRATYKLRPEGEVIIAEQTEEERVSEKKSEFVRAYELCLNGFELNKPFYPARVHKEIDEALSIARKEFVEYKHGDDRKSEYWENAEQNYQSLIDAIDKVCISIRKRVGLIKVK